MGARYRLALVAASPHQLAEIAERCQPLLQHFDNPINFSLVCMAAPQCEPLTVGLGLIAFQSREVFGFATPPASIKDCLRLAYSRPAPTHTMWSFITRSEPRIEPNQIEVAWDDLVRTPALAIAKVASEVTGESLCALYSDTTCSSGLLRFANGNLAAGEVYGSGGTDVLLKFKDNEATPAIVGSESEFNYADTIASGLLAYFGERFPIDSFMNDGLEEYRRFVLMEGRVLLSPPKGET